MIEERFKDIKITSGNSLKGIVQSQAETISNEMEKIKYFGSFYESTNRWVN